ncbi:MAG: cytosolic protein [Anaerolineae bacterium]
MDEAPQRSDYDSPWKETLEVYFEQFVQFFFPIAHADIDWLRGYEFLDKELQKVVRDSSLGRRYGDKLARVWLLNGEEAWVLIHVEIQGQVEQAFDERIFVYYYRLFDRYQHKVVSLVVLADAQPTWRPGHYGYSLWGCEISFRFPTVKLHDYGAHWDELAARDNPFATVVMAHLKAQETRRDDEQRKLWKITLIRRLYERGYKREDVLNLFRFIDWVLVLPETVENEIWRVVTEMEEAQHMTYITSIERIGMKRGYETGRLEGKQEGIQLGIQQGIQQGEEIGLRQGLLTGIALGLELKFGFEAVSVLPEVYKIEDVDVLRALQQGLRTAKNLIEWQNLYRPEKRLSES